MGTSLIRRAAVALILLLASPARAQRPSYTPATELTHDGEAGHVRVHYATTSADAVPADDADADGTPDYVQEVAALAETAWDDLEARGFRPPVTDTGLVAGDDGGDARFDIYLRNLMSGDGHFTSEACTSAPVHCAGYFAIENDLVGLNYSSRTEGISVLTSHELFHAVQNAYVPGLAVAWSEGTAVWNEEQTFPEQDDYERFVAEFLARPQRPFDRSGTGFGDAYAYGAALWPTFLDERYGDGTVRRSWEACEVAGEGANFLDAIGQVLSEDGQSLESAWTEFSRWNLFTGERADATRAYRSGAGLAPVATEAPLTMLGAAATSIEGMSARYLPIAAPAGQGDPLRITVQVVDGGAAAAYFPIDGSGGVGEEVELTSGEQAGLLAARLPPEQQNGILVLTGLRRGGFPRDATVEIGVAPPDDKGGDEESGCQAARSGSVPGSVVLLLAAAAFLRRRPLQHHRPGGSQ